MITVNNVYKVFYDMWLIVSSSYILPTFFKLKRRRCACGQLLGRPAFCGAMDYSPPGSSAHGIFQTKILECGAISYSSGSFQSRDQSHVICISCIGRWFFTLAPLGSPKKERNWNTNFINTISLCLKKMEFITYKYHDDPLFDSSANSFQWKRQR